MKDNFTTVTEELENSKKEIQKLMNELNVERNNSKKISEEKSLLEKELCEVQKKFDESCRNFDRELVEARKNFDEIQSKLDKVENSNTELEWESAKTKRKLETTNNELEELRNRLMTLQGKNQEQISRLLDKNEELLQEIKNLNQVQASTMTNSSELTKIIESRSVIIPSPENLQLAPSKFIMPPPPVGPPPAGSKKRGTNPNIAQKPFIQSEQPTVTRPTVTQPAIAQEKLYFPFHQGTYSQPPTPGVPPEFMHLPRYLYEQYLYERYLDSIPGHYHQ
jgi:uncharacterized phage infection (PIP) family protein YhgE